MAKNKCTQNYEKEIGRKVSEKEQGDLFDLLNDVKRRTTVNGKTYGANVTDQVDKTASLKAKQNTTKLIQDAQTIKAERNFNNYIENTFNHIKENEPKFKNKPDADIYNEAVLRTVFTTNKMSDMTLEAMWKTNKKGATGELFRELESIEGFNFNDMRKRDSQLRRDVLTELFELYKRPTVDKGVTKNSVAFQIAKSFLNITIKQIKRRNRFGANDFVFHNRLKPKFKQKRVTKNKEQFIDDLTQRLDPEVHGDINARRREAESIANDIESGEDWRNITAAYKEQTSELGVIPELSPDLETKVKGSTIAFKDGESFEYLVRQYGENDVFDTMLGSIDELSRKTSLIQFFGPKVDEGILRFENLVKNKRIQGKGSGAALRWIERLHTPSVDENSAWQRFFTVARNLQAAAKLGGAAITALMDTATMSNAASRLYKIPPGRVLKNIFGFELKGTKGEKQKQARYLGIGLDGLLGFMQERFALRGTTDGTLEKGTFNFAYQLFKMSGLNWWTDGRKAMSANLFLTDLGDNISKGRLWSTLDPQYKARLARFGIGETDWQRLLKEKPLSLDKDNVLDLFALPELDSEIGIGKVPLRQKLHAFIDDAVDTMVITPGQFDIEIASAFADPRGAGQIFRSMFQFKSHPMTFFRKQWMGSYGSKQDKVRAIAGLTVQLTLLGGAVVTLKDIAAGRQPREWNDPEFMVRAVETGGAAGIVSDMFMTFGGKDILTAIAGGDENAFYGSTEYMNIWGPLFGDFIKLTSTVMDATAEGYRWAVKDEEFDRTKFANITKVLSNNVPFQNLWYTKMLYKHYLHDTMMEYIDPDGYRRTKRKLIRDARKERMNGKYNNILYESLPFK